MITDYIALICLVNTFQSNQFLKKSPIGELQLDLLFMSNILASVLTLRSKLENLAFKNRESNRIIHFTCLSWLVRNKSFIERS